jgi:hypothetical protein
LGFQTGVGFTINLIQAGMIVTSDSSPAKSVVFRVTIQVLCATAVAAIIRSMMRDFGLRPCAITYRMTAPYAIAAVSSKGKPAPKLALRRSNRASRDAPSTASALAMMPYRNSA